MRYMNGKPKTISELDILYQDGEYEIAEDEDIAENLGYVIGQKC